MAHDALNLDDFLTSTLPTVGILDNSTLLFDLGAGVVELLGGELGLIEVLAAAATLDPGRAVR